MWISYRLVNIPAFADFLIAVEAEMNKVSWPTRHELIPGVAGGAGDDFLLAVVLFGFDLFWSWFFTGLHVSCLTVSDEPNWLNRERVRLASDDRASGRRTGRERATAAGSDVAPGGSAGTLPQPKAGRRACGGDARRNRAPGRARRRAGCTESPCEPVARRARPRSLRRRPWQPSSCRRARCGESPAAEVAGRRCRPASRRLPSRRPTSSRPTGGAETPAAAEVGQKAARPAEGGEASQGGRRAGRAGSPPSRSRTR